MRNLTIKRTKSFVASLAKMKVYIEDASSGELTINNISCRKIGDIKNGEEKTFQIDEQSAKVFVIADKLSKNYCNEFYELPAGQEDIFLTGKNKFNPANGNAFRFDNNESEEIVANRKKGTRKGLIILAIAIILGGTVGCLGGIGVGVGILFNKAKEPKIFTYDDMSITLTNAFKETDIDSFSAVYDSRDVAVFVVKEEFSLAEGFEDYTIDQYAELVMEVNGLSDSEIRRIDDLTSFEYEYTNPETEETYKYSSFTYKTEDAFWLVQFTTLNEKFDEYSNQIVEWAKSVEFSN